MTKKLFTKVLTDQSGWPRIQEGALYLNVSAGYGEQKFGDSYRLLWDEDLKSFVASGVWDGSFGPGPSSERQHSVSIPYAEVVETLSKEVADRAIELCKVYDRQMAEFMALRKWADENGRIVDFDSGKLVEIIYDSAEVVFEMIGYKNFTSYWSRSADGRYIMCTRTYDKGNLFFYSMDGEPINRLP